MSYELQTASATDLATTVQIWTW